MAREIANDTADEELREFAEGGARPTEADPAFEATLREKLWRLLRRRLEPHRDGEPTEREPERAGGELD